MSEPNLSSLLEPIASDVQRIRFWAGVRRRAYVLTLTAFVFIGVHHFAGWTWTSLAPALYLILTVSLFHHFWTRKRLKPSFGEIARLIERDHPELASKLMAAQEQKPDPETGRLNFLQERLLREAVEEHQRQQWGNRFVERAFFSQCASIVVLALCLSVIASMKSDGTARLASKLLERMHGVEVTPGDTELESGSSLVVLARFHDQIPKGATLVLQPVSGAVQRLPLARNLGDPVFGTSLPEVRQEMTYHLEYDSAKTKSYRVKVYELPALIRADAELAYPAYTGLPSRTYEDTRRVTAVEGTGLRYHLTLNKPVTSGKLVAKDGRTLDLAVEPGQTNRYLVATTLMQSGKFDLRLVDADGRTNREPTEFVIEVLKNRTPELKFVMPKGDQRVSPLAEIRFEGQASDDFGVKAYGIAYSMAEKDPVYLQLGTNTAANEKRTFTHTLALEKLGVQSEQLISYHLWADDIGPDGQLRRTMTDMFFAEARPFEEVFREGKAPEGEGEPPPQSQKTMKLAKLQREILSATWKLQRRENATSPTAKYRTDVDVVKQSQAEAIRQVDALIEKSDDERTTALLNVAKTSMNKALTNLSEAADKNAVPPLVPAVAGEQAAANALMKLLPREHQVVQSRSRKGGGGGEENQRQLDQLDLKQEEKNYEKEKTASSPKSPEQQEQLQVLNRLKELAQRQEAVNERVKELQTALQEAKTEAEREQIRRQLKRLKEEQQQMLADLDELRQRMDRPENQASMAEARQRLEQTREDMRKMSEELEKGATSQAAAAGTKVERELEQMRDDFRKKTAGQFTESMRDLRQKARELAEKQEEIGRKLAGEQKPQRRSLSDTDDSKKTVEALEDQRQKMSELVKEATAVTEQAEAAEPLLSKQLYETLRQTSQAESRAVRDTTQELVQKGKLTRGAYTILNKAKEQGGNRSIETAAELLKNDYTAEAAALEEKARKNVQELKRGVEKAAESVLGDEVESLRFAQKEAEALAQQVQREMQAAKGEKGSEQTPGGKPSEQPQAGKGTPGDMAKNSKSAGKQPGQGSPDGKDGEGKSAAKGGKGSGEQPGSTPGEGSGKAQAKSGKGSGEGSGQGTTPGKGQGQGQGQGEGQSAQTAQSGSRNGGGMRNGGGGEGGGLLNQGWERGAEGPLTGERFTQWSDRMRNLEETVESPELRNDIARVREAARSMRSDFKRHGAEPKWELVETQITKPMAQVRDRLKEELARRESREALVPVDRDPVPQRFSEMVRRYYEKLGGNE